jgi:hypothetical protein
VISAGTVAGGEEALGGTVGSGGVESTHRGGGVGASGGTTGGTGGAVTGGVGVGGAGGASAGGGGASSICELPLDPGACDSGIQILGFFFNSSTRRCEHFIYCGGRGNANRFDTRESCRGTCGGLAVELCSLPVEPFDCQDYPGDYYFDAQTGRCEQYEWPLCGRNDNRFETEEACLETCGPEFSCPGALPAANTPCSVAGRCVVAPDPLCPALASCTQQGQWLLSLPGDLDYLDGGDTRRSEGWGCPVDPSLAECRAFGPCPAACLDPAWTGLDACAACDSGAIVARTFDCLDASSAKHGCTTWAMDSESMLVLLQFDQACGERVVVDRVRTCADSIDLEYSVHVSPSCACSDWSEPMEHVVWLAKDSRPVRARRTLVDPGGCYSSGR